MTRTADDLDARGFRDAMGHFASGVTVVSAISAEGPVGFTCQSFSSLSLDPPLVSISVMRTSTSYPRVRATGSFLVNVLAHDHAALSSQFARSGSDKWAGVRWSPSARGNPVIADAVMWVDCDIWAEHDAGDHRIVVGAVREFGSRPSDSAEPLVFYRGRYRRLHPDVPR